MAARRSKLRTIVASLRRARSASLSPAGGGPGDEIAQLDNGRRVLRPNPLTNGQVVRILRDDSHPSRFGGIRAREGQHAEEGLRGDARDDCADPGEHGGDYRGSDAVTPW